MRNSITLIDKARSLCTPPTDYELAKRLGIKSSTISRCRRRGGTFDNEAALRLAQFLGQPPLDVIAIMEAERATTPEKRRFWENQLPRCLPLVAIVGAVSGLLTTIPVNSLYIMRSRLRRAATSRWHMLRQTGYALGRYAPRMVYEEPV